MYAIGKNKVTCAEPGGRYKDTEGVEVLVHGCCQPGTELIKVSDDPLVELEYCERHAYEIWKAEDESSL